MEFMFFRDLGEKKIQKWAAGVIVATGLSLAAAGFFIFLDGNFSLYFKELYEMRPFSMYERLLTQPRVLLFYLFQIFYPIVNQFSIEHDFAVSTSLFTPWTTFPAILIIFTLIIIAFWRIKRNPILSFAILFYFGNHVIESSIIPLEMVFEHRNYLPTLFLFTPIAIGIKKAFDHYYKTQKPMFYFLVFSVCAVMIGLGTSTYIRNWDWRSEKSLCEDAMKKAPQSSRAAHNLAYGYYAPTGQIDKALELYRKALNLAGHQTIFKADIYNNIAALYYSPLKEYEKTVEYAQKAIAVYSRDDYKLLLYEALIMIPQYDQALVILDELIDNAPNNSALLYRKGFMLLKKGQAEEALKFFRKCLHQFPFSWKYHREIGLCLTQMGNYKVGYWFLKRSIILRPNSVGILLGLAGNRLLAGSLDEAEPWIEQFIDQMKIKNIENFLVKISEDPLGLPVLFTDLRIAISRCIRLRSEEYEETADRLLKSSAEFSVE